MRSFNLSKFSLKREVKKDALVHSHDGAYEGVYVIKVDWVADLSLADLYHSGLVQFCHTLQCIFERLYKLKRLSEAGYIRL